MSGGVTWSRWLGVTSQLSDTEEGRGEEEKETSREKEEGEEGREGKDRRSHCPSVCPSD